MKPLTRTTRMGRRVSGLDAREQLLDVATALFAERGIANTTVKQIAAGGGVTSAMVHYWFQTRERLLDAVAEERIARALHAVWGPFDPEDDAALTQTLGIVGRMFDATEKMPWLPSLWLREIVAEGGLLRERAFTHIPVKKVLAFGQTVARAKARGELNLNIDPSLLFNSILALVMLPQATAQIWKHLKQPASFDRALVEGHVTALLIHGLTGDVAHTDSAKPKVRKARLAVRGMHKATR